MRGVRQAVSRVRPGRACVTLPPGRRPGRGDHRARAGRADQWRDGAVERGFSMALGRFGDPATPAASWCPPDPDGALRGLLHFVPWGGDGLSLDLMRRDRAPRTASSSPWWPG